MANLQTFFPYSTLYITGLNLAWASNTTLTISPGLCRDSTNSYDINASAGSFTLNGAVNGVNGLDTGNLAASTWYAVYVIHDYTHQNVNATLLSTSATNPLLPATHNSFRRIGWVRTDGSSHFLKFYQCGNANDRFYQWDSLATILSGGTATTFTAQSLAAGAPPQAMPVYLTLTYTGALSGNLAGVRPTGSSATIGVTPITINAINAATLRIFPAAKILPALSGGQASIEYIVTASDLLSISLGSFEDCV